MSFGQTIQHINTQHNIPVDDANLILLDQDIDKIFNSMQNELEKTSTWFKANKLSFNISKTKYLLCHPQDKNSEIPQHLPPLKINNTLVEGLKVSKFLGVVLDEKL